MPATAPFTPPKKKLRIWWWIGSFVFVLFVLYLYQLVGPSPRIVVSKETTYINKPLLENGLPDYEAYMRAKLSYGVTPDNNAAVLLWKAVVPADVTQAEHDAVAMELGAQQVAAPDKSLETLFGEANRKRVKKWLGKPDPAREDTPFDDDEMWVFDAVAYPWTSEQLPPMAEWLAANQASLDLIVEASRRPRYYLPATQLSGVRIIRESARGLSARAAWHIGENRLAEAWQDNLAIYRLSALYAQGLTLSDQLVAFAVRGMAAQTTSILLTSDHLTKPLPQQIQRDLATVLPFGKIADCVDQGERMLGLRAVLHVRSDGLDAVNQFRRVRQESTPFRYASVDWNVVLQDLNQAYDAAAAAMRIADYEERNAALQQFQADMSDRAANVKKSGRLFRAAFSRRARGEVVGDTLNSMLFPAMTVADAAEARTNSHLSLTQVAAALAVYRAEHGAYPDKLDDLAPAIIPSLPVDLYHTKPFVYKRIDQGYLLYTLGENGTDDDGSNEQMSIVEGRELDGVDPAADDALRAKIPAGADDISIRLPIPLFKLPTQPALDSTTAP